MNFGVCKPALARLQMIAALYALFHGSGQAYGEGQLAQHLVCKPVRS